MLKPTQTQKNAVRNFIHYLEGYLFLAIPGGLLLLLTPVLAVILPCDRYGVCCEFITLMLLPLLQGPFFIVWSILLLLAGFYYGERGADVLMFTGLCSAALVFFSCHCGGLRAWKDVF